MDFGSSARRSRVLRRLSKILVDFEIQVFWKLDDEVQGFRFLFGLFFKNFLMLKIDDKIIILGSSLESWVGFKSIWARNEI